MNLQTTIYAGGPISIPVLGKKLTHEVDFPFQYK